MRILRLFIISISLIPQFASSEILPLPPDGVTVAGEIRSIRARQEDTLSDIARRYGLGYQEVVLANPGIDPWLPGEGTKITLPTQYILPDGPREGVVVNVPEMRLYYYPKPKPGEMRVVVTHPISIGRMDWKTPLGLTKVTAKKANPAWYPPESVRLEHAQRGDILPKVVPPGPQNPLGQYAMRLGIPGYLIHGTNNPYGVGMRVTHGCIRLYPEDIQSFFDQVPVGAPVRIVNQPLKAGWRDSVLYLESHPALDEDKGEFESHRTAAVKAVVKVSPEGNRSINWATVQQIADAGTGIPIAVSSPVPAIADNSLENTELVEQIDN